MANLSTKLDTNKVYDKRSKIQELKAFHDSLFEKENMAYPKFIPRLKYKHEGVEIISFFENEINGGSDIYVEFCSRDYDPEDPERQLWKWIYNPEYKTEYKRSEPHATTGDIRYLIPVDELINITKLHKNKIENEVKEEMKYELPDLESDIPFNAMTLRDYMAIQWKKPVSHKKWLNELVEKYYKL
jgi:hypothetical protein